MVQRLIFLLLAAILLVALWAFMAPSPPVIGAAAPVISSAPSATHQWQLRDDDINGPSEIVATIGDTLTLEFISDVDDEIHLHGYERALSLRANMPASLTLSLMHSGQFELESHRLHRVLGHLRVEPR